MHPQRVTWSWKVVARNVESSRSWCAHRWGAGAKAFATTFGGRLSIFEQHHACGEAVDEVLASHGAQLALREEAGERDGARGLAHRLGVVVRPAEQAGAATVATEEQATRRRAGRLKHEPQVFIGAVGVADVELDGLADADVVADRDGAGVAVEADQVADQEIAAAEGVAVFADRPADHQAALH